MCTIVLSLNDERIQVLVSKCIPSQTDFPTPASNMSDKRIHTQTTTGVWSGCGIIVLYVSDVVFY